MQSLPALRVPEQSGSSLSLLPEHYFFTDPPGIVTGQEIDDTWTNVVWQMCESAKDAMDAAEEGKLCIAFPPTLIFGWVAVEGASSSSFLKRFLKPSLIVDP